jgi:hypothetical protein
MTVALLVLLGPVVPASTEVSITLKDTFIKRYQDRATVAADCTVDKSKGQPNSPAKDGDMHIAVRCPSEIALPLVAEVMNARDHMDIVDASVQAEQSQIAVKIAGAWRIWNEHGGDDTKFVQGRAVGRGNSTNPDHAFEIHPITSFNGLSALQSFKQIEGYTPKEADRAFVAYDGVQARIRKGNGTTTITSNGVGYNYVNFQMELSERPFEVSDGRFAFARVRDWEGHLLLRKKRMVFVKDTPPEIAVRNAQEGDCFRVLGIPRLDLALVSWRIREAARGRSEVLNWNLPYEIIVVGVYDQQCEVD